MVDLNDFPASTRQSVQFVVSLCETVRKSADALIPLRDVALRVFNAIEKKQPVCGISYDEVCFNLYAAGIDTRADLISFLYSSPSA